MCEELTHVKCHLGAKQLIVLPTQFEILESRALKQQMPLIVLMHPHHNADKACLHGPRHAQCPVTMAKR